MWRLFLDGLPTDESVRRLGIPIISRCLCCFNSEESLNHLFFNGKWAEEVWSFIHRRLGVQIPTGINMFRRVWIPNFKAKRYFHCLCFGLACCGLWEVWKMRNAKAHGVREYCLTSRMDLWVAKLVRIIPVGVLSRREAYILDNLNIKQYFMERPVWTRWHTSEPGNWMHVAIVSSGDTCKCGALIRDQHGRFMHAMVRSMQKSNAMREFLHFVGSSLGDARNLNIKVRHIISSHECCFRFNKAQDRDVPWEAIEDTRRMDAEYGPVDFHRVTACANNAAICLTYCSHNNSEFSSFSDLPLALKKCILADEMKLPALDIGLHNREEYRYPDGRAEDDGIRRPRRPCEFSDDMGIDL